MAIKGICLVLTAILGIDVHFVSVYKNAKRYLAILTQRLVKSAYYILTWDQAHFERFSYILSNGHRWNWAWYKLLQVCARYGQILAVTLIGC